MNCAYTFIIVLIAKSTNITVYFLEYNRNNSYCTLFLLRSKVKDHKRFS